MKSKIFLLLSSAVLFLTLCSCGTHAEISSPEPVHSIERGDGLSAIALDGTYYAAEPPEYCADAVSAYTTADPNLPDVCVFSYPADSGETLEAYGQERAAEKGVFCNTMTIDGETAAVLNYYQNDGENGYIAQSYIYKGETGFSEVLYLFKTEEIPLGDSGLSVRIANGYTSGSDADSLFPTEYVYETESDMLPALRIREFDKDYFSEATYSDELLPETTKEEFSLLALDGWTLEEGIDFYADRYELKKGELMHRNGLDIAFIGYIDNGIFTVRAIIDTGSDYVMLCAEDDAAEFQHITTALIDSIN